MGYPIQLAHLEGKRVLVAGGGTIAAQKIDALIASGARVHVIAASVTEALAPFTAQLDRLETREVREADVEGAALVIAATDDPAINRLLAAAATARGILVNAVDDPSVSSFYAPAVIRRGPVTLTIGTGGGSPLFSAQLRRALEAALPRSLDSVASLFVALRERGLKGLAKRSKILRALADPMIGRLVDRGDTEAAATRLEAIAREEEEPFLPGTVVIAGAGPGSAGLLTLRALDRIQRADVILHDALVEPEVLALALPGTRIVCVGRRAAEPGADPSVGIALMLREAAAGARVVRLHAGDPLVFGRAGEELDALLGAGIAFELVPGVSAVLAAPAAAKVPLTKRGEASSFTVRTGHSAHGWVSSAPSPDEQTLVILMGVGGARGLLSGLIEEGWAPETPAVAVSCASRRGEKILRATIATLADKIESETLGTPATLIIGKVAARARDTEKGSAAVVAA